MLNTYYKNKLCSQRGAVWWVVGALVLPSRKKTVKLAKVLRVLSSIFSFYSFIGIFRVGDTSVDPPTLAVCCNSS